MSIYSSRAVGSYGYFGQAFGAAENPVVGALGFSHPGSLRDYLSKTGDTGWQQGLSAYGLTYSGPSSALLSSANKSYTLLSTLAATDPAAEVKFRALTTKTQLLLDNVDALTKQKSPFGGLEQGVERQRVNYMKDLTRVLNEWATAAPASASLEKAVSSALEARAAQTTAGGAPPAQPAEESGGTWLYVALGVGGLALLAGVVLLARKRAPATAGYRRRRRRR